MKTLFSDSPIETFYMGRNVNAPILAEKKLLKDVTISNNVTKLCDYAFYDCEVLTNVELPEGITSIGRSAFGYCDKLSSISIPANVIQIGSYAFEYCKAIKEIISWSTVPPTIDYYTFNNVDKTIPVYVPKGCVDTYKKAPYWRYFTNIKGELSGVTLIDNDAPDAKVEYYDLGGRRVEKPTNGLYVVKQGNTVRKEVIKQ